MAPCARKQVGAVCRDECDEAGEQDNEAAGAQDEDADSSARRRARRTGTFAAACRGSNADTRLVTGATAASTCESIVNLVV